MEIRHIPMELVNYFDDKLAHNAIAQELKKQKNARSLMVHVAACGVGIREVGANNGPLVTLIQRTVGGPDHVAWCMSYVQSVIAYIEVITGVKSPLPASEHCLTVWRTTPGAYRVKTLPLPGAVVIYQHGTSSSGHTGVVEATDGETIFNYEGNTGGGVTPSGKIQREGDGVYHTHRNLHPAGEMHLLGFLKPFESLPVIHVAQ